MLSFGNRASCYYRSTTGTGILLANCWKMEDEKGRKIRNDHGWRLGDPVGLAIDPVDASEGPCPRSDSLPVMGANHPGHGGNLASRRGYGRSRRSSVLSQGEWLRHRARSRVCFRSIRLSTSPGRKGRNGQPPPPFPALGPAHPIICAPTLLSQLVAARTEPIIAAARWRTRQAFKVHHEPQPSRERGLGCSSGRRLTPVDIVLLTLANRVLPLGSTAVVCSVLVLGRRPAS